MGDNMGEHKKSIDDNGGSKSVRIHSEFLQAAIAVALPPSPQSSPQPTIKEFLTAGAAVGAESVVPPKQAAYSRVAGDEEIAIDNDSAAIGCESSIPGRTLLHLFGINAFAFAYGLLISTFGIIVLPLEAERLWPEKHALLLAIFLGVCGISQLSGPIAGYFSDRCDHNFGRRRPFMFYGGSAGLFSLMILRWASVNNNLTVYLVFFFTAMLALNVMYVAYSGALTDLVNETQRGVANGLMGAFTVLGASAGFGCFSYFLELQSGYIFYVGVLAISVAISLAAYSEVPLKSVTFNPLSWKDISECYWLDPTDQNHRDFFLVFVSRTFYYMGVSVQTFMLFYFRDVIRSDDPKADVSYLALCGQLSGAIFCVPMGMLSNRLGRKFLIYISSAIIIGTYVMFMFCQSRSMALLAGAIYGIGNGAYLSVDYALACDTLPSSDMAAKYLGIWGVGAFIGTLLGPLLMGPALILFGEKVDDNGIPMYDIEGYIVALIIGCLCLFMGAAVVTPIRSAK